MGNNFILIASDTYTVKYGELSGYDITEYRLDDAKWPIYANTRNKNIISSDDNIIVYIAGKQQNSMSFVAKAKVDTVLEFKYKTHISDYEPEHIAPTKIVMLKDIHWLNKPLKIHDILDKLLIVPINKKKWGCIMHGGCRRLTDHDYNLIVDSIT